MSSAAAPFSKTGSFRATLSVLALVVLAVVGARLGGKYLNSPAVPRPIDFLQVWAAGRLHLAGENPYDPVRMLELQRANRLPDDRASMMWNPPWALALVMPLGALPVNAAQVLWLGLLFASVVGAALLLWRLAGGTRDRVWVPVAAALTFAPTWFLLVGGQIVAVALVGVVGFLAALRANRPVLAGACVALTAIKPHLFVPLAIGLLIDAIRCRDGRRILLGGIIVAAAASLVATLPNADVWRQYVAATTGVGSEQHKSLTDWVNPTIGAWVRALLPGRPFWVQWVPTLAAAMAFGIHWWRRGSLERWCGVMPWVIPLGLLTAPYGSWMCDQVLLLVPLIVLLARLTASPATHRRLWPIAVIFAICNVGSIVMMVSKVGQEYYVWFAPVMVVCLTWAHRIESRGPVVSSAPQVAGA